MAGSGPAGGPRGDAAGLAVAIRTSLPPAGDGCLPQAPIATGDIAYLHGVETGINRMLAAEAARHRATYVNTYLQPVAGWAGWNGLPGRGE